MEHSHLRIMRNFVERKLTIWPEFTAALVVGSVATGEARSDSDVDCILIFDKFNEGIVPAEFVWNPSTDTFHTIFDVEATDVGGVQVDANRVELSNFLNQEWSDDLKHDLAHALMIYDRHQTVSQAIEEKLSYSDTLRISRIQNHLGWASYHLEEWRLQGWVERGGIESAHDQITAALEQIIQLLHAYNREWLPSRYRWLVSTSRLKWLPTKCLENLRDAICQVSPDKESLLKRRSVLISVLNSIRKKLEEDDLLSSPLDAFVADHPGLGYAHNFDSWLEEHQSLIAAREGS